ncbi:MAG: hypothetical protein CSA95_05965 [Bacteroidetes bacterium]|nr:MAG: hypothetical protein CSA95_05965 [Bacteroidota bacterium]PIE88732.1 MAG: hypothetical protein CSA04_00370 [Bacteroidota bacterium]
MKSIKLLGIFLLITASLLNTSCSKKEADNHPNAPQLPPKASFIMDYSFSKADTAHAKGYAHFGYSAINVLFWNVVLTGNLAIPVAAFSESFNHEPEYIGNLEWVWSYDVTVINQVYHANLHGTLVGTDVEWKMYLSKEGAYTDFLWYEGVMDSTYQEAEWLIYQSPEEPALFLTVNYLNDLENGEQSIRYTKAEEIITEESYIEHGNRVDVDMDRYYTIYLQDGDKLTEIEWNYAAGNGHVRDEVHFGDQEWHCWDEQRRDIECP